MKKFYYMIAVPPDMLIQECIEADNQIEAYAKVCAEWPNAKAIRPMDEPLRGDGVMKYIDTGLGPTATT